MILSRHDSVIYRRLLAKAGRDGYVLAPYLDWIGNTTGLTIPEPSLCWLLSLGLAVLVLRRHDTAD
jgi:hypothetical protein